MSTVTEICTQIVVVLDALNDIDFSSTSQYLPVVTTQRVALLVPPLGLRGTVGAPVGRKTKLVHRIPCELWIRIDNGDLAAGMTRGRDICLEAAAELQATLTLNNTIDFFGDGEGAAPFEWAVDDEMIQIGNNSKFVRATLFVTVTKWVVLQA